MFGGWGAVELKNQDLTIEVVKVLIGIVDSPSTGAEIIKLVLAKRF